MSRVAQPELKSQSPLTSLPVSRADAMPRRVHGPPSLFPPSRRSECLGRLAWIRHVSKSGRGQYIRGIGWWSEETMRDGGELRFLASILSTFRMAFPRLPTSACSELVLSHYPSTFGRKSWRLHPLSAVLSAVSGVLMHFRLQVIRGQFGIVHGAIRFDEGITTRLPSWPPRAAWHDQMGHLQRRL